MRTKLQVLLERLWTAAILAYTLFATFVVWKTLGKYGVNPIGFFVVDLITSYTYGISTARAVVAVMNRDWKALQKWLWVASASFTIPNIYILIFARGAPHHVYRIVIIVVIILVAFALGSLLIQLRKAVGRKDKRGPEEGS